jgi:hypothetical protein
LARVHTPWLAHRLPNCTTWFKMVQNVQKYELGQNCTMKLLGESFLRSDRKIERDPGPLGPAPPAPEQRPRPVQLAASARRLHFYGQRTRGSIQMQPARRGSQKQTMKHATRHTSKSWHKQAQSDRQNQMLLGASPRPHQHPEALHFCAFSCPHHPHRREIGLTEIQGEMGKIFAELGAEGGGQAPSREGPC